MIPGSVTEEVKQFTDNIIQISNEKFKKSSNKVKNKFNKPWWTEECQKTIAISRGGNLLGKFADIFQPIQYVVSLGVGRASR